MVGPLVCNPSATAAGAAASNASGKHADKSVIADSFESFEASIYRQPQLKLPRHSMRAAMPVSSADSLFDAKEYPQDRLPPANLKFQRAVQQTCAWSNLVKVSTTTSFEGAKDVLCFIDSSYSRMHLFDDASATEILNCTLDSITLRACSGKPGTDTAVVVTLLTPATDTRASTLYLRRTAPCQARHSPPPVPSLATMSRVSVGTRTSTRGELISRVLIHFLGSGTTYDSNP